MLRDVPFLDKNINYSEPLAGDIALKMKSYAGRNAGQELPSSRRRKEVMKSAHQSDKASPVH